MTSQLIPSLANSSAAASATFMILPNDTMVTSVPARLMSATPMGRMKSPSGTSPLSPYICSDSIKMTGSWSRIAALSKPLASYTVLGTITFKPGQLAYQLSNACEWVAPSWPALAVGPRNTIGIVNCPADIWCILAALLMIWSMATIEKLNVMNSMMGRRPFIAAPTPIPANPSSAMGVSSTRLAPNSSSIPLEAL